MIKLTVHEQVRTALQQAFPGYNVARALNKYVATLERLLFQSLQNGQTNEQRLFKLYSLSTHELAQKGGCIGPKKIRLHKWLADNGLMLVESVTKGSNLSGRYSQCKLTPWVECVDVLEATLGDPLGSLTDPDIDQRLMASRVAAAEMLALIYPGFLELDDEPLARCYDLVEVDRASLKAYIAWLTSGSPHLAAGKKATALRQARIILVVAEGMQGHFPQRKQPSPFGRTYYQGISVQSVNKTLRRAMLGHCWCYDIRSSVIAWKMGFAAAALAEANTGATVRSVFRTTLTYLEDKKDFVTTVRRYTFKADSACAPALQVKLIKQALTAMSFGARLSTRGWRDESGQMHNPALVDILKNADERQRFINNAVIRAFIHEQKQLDDYIYGQVKLSVPELLQTQCVQSPSGRPSKAKVLAYLYQHAETGVMQRVKAILIQQGHTVLAHIHDAVITRRKWGLDLRLEIEQTMQDHTRNPYWRLAPEELKGFERQNTEEDQAIAAHRQRIRDEEARAKAIFEDRRRSGG
jgi:hypothetical protein